MNAPPRDVLRSMSRTMRDALTDAERTGVVVYETIHPATYEALKSRGLIGTRTPGELTTLGRTVVEIMRAGL